MPKKRTGHRTPSAGEPTSAPLSLPDARFGYYRAYDFGHSDLMHDLIHALEQGSHVGIRVAVKVLGRSYRCAARGLIFIGLTVMSAANSADEPIVFGAASLTGALQEIARRYALTTSSKAHFSFAASSTLARQIEAGAPAQIFASANPQWMDYLAERNLIDSRTRVDPIGNSLVLVTAGTSSLTSKSFERDLQGLATFTDEDWIAVADPDHVPAGIYAKQALLALGYWTGLEQRLARTDNVLAALALVERGEVAAGIVYRTDARLSKTTQVLATFPARSHAPITYSFAILRNQGSPATQRLFSFMTGAEGLRVFEQFGFFAQ